MKPRTLFDKIAEQEKTEGRKQNNNQKTQEPERAKTPGNNIFNGPVPEIVSLFAGTPEEVQEQIRKEYPILWTCIEWCKQAIEK